MLVWKRMGFLVPLIWAAMVIVAHASKFNELVDKPTASSLVLIFSGIVYWFLGKQLNKDVIIEAIDRKSGQSFIINKSHTFFFIRIEYWSLIAISFAAYIYLKS